LPRSRWRRRVWPPRVRPGADASARHCGSPSVAAASRRPLGGPSSAALARGCQVDLDTTMAWVLAINSRASRHLLTPVCPRVPGSTVRDRPRSPFSSAVSRSRTRPCRRCPGRQLDRHARLLGLIAHQVAGLLPASAADECWLVSAGLRASQASGPSGVPGFGSVLHSGAVLRAVGPFEASAPSSPGGPHPKPPGRNYWNVGWAGLVVSRVRPSIPPLGRTFFPVYWPGPCEGARPEASSPVGPRARVRGVCLCDVPAS
jgi:hypothetical protein